MRRLASPIGSLTRWACAALFLALAVRAEEPAKPSDLGETGLPFLEVFEPREFVGHTQVWATVEARDGTMFFGNLGRVLGFDGARWSHIDVPNTSFVRGLAVDAEDVLWIGAVNEIGYAKPDPTGRRTFVSLRDKLPPEAREFGEVWRVLLTPRGPMFQSNSWMLRWDGRAFAAIALDPPTPGWQVNVTGKTVWVTHPRQGWFHLADDGTRLSLVPQTRPAAYEGTALLVAVPGRTPNEFVFCTGRFGLVRWDGTNFTPLPTIAEEYLRTKRPYRACGLPDGRFAISTLQAGALVFDADGTLLMHLDERSGLPDNTVINVGGDRHGGLWICLERGVVRADVRRWLTWLGPLNGLPRSQLGMLRFQDSIFAATTTGLMKLAPATAATPARFQPVPEMREYLSSLTEAGNVLIGLSEQGIFQWPSPAGERQLGDVHNATTFVPSRSQPGRWFAIANEQLHTFRRVEGRWLVEGPVKGVENVRSLHEEANGTYWFGLSVNGLLKVTFPDASDTSPGPPKVERLGVDQGLPPNHGWVRIMGIRGRILISCEKGLFRLDASGKRFEPTKEFGERFADGTFTARAVVEDGQGGVWIAARAAGQLELVTPIDIGRVDERGWRPLQVPQLLKLDDVMEIRLDRQILWICGHSGIIRVDLARWQEAPPAPLPQLIMSAVTTNDGTHLPLVGGWTLPFARRSLRIAFAAPSLVRDPLANYESVLTSGTESTVLTDANAERSFGALGAGDYSLRLRARGSDGRWSQPLMLAFTVLPPWWASTWAWLGYATLLGLAIAGGVRQRTRALERRAEHLEAVVQVRTEELRKSNVELARLHKLELDERIAARLAEEKARLEVLRYQLNPHFLFNALTSVRAQLPGTLTGARETIGQLTEFCRSTLLRPASGGHPALAQEMEMLSAYLAIEKTRWGDLLEVEKDIAPDAGEALVPPLLLLPLIENALKYGRATSPDTLRIRLAARLEGDTLVIEISNTGSWVEPEQRGNLPSLGIGMENLRQRLHRFFPEAHEFSTTAADGWVRMVLRLKGEPVA